MENSQDYEMSLDRKILMWLGIAMMISLIALIIQRVLT